MQSNQPSDGGAPELFFRIFTDVDEPASLNLCTLVVSGFIHPIRFQSHKSPNKLLPTTGIPKLVKPDEEDKQSDQRNDGEPKSQPQENTSSRRLLRLMILNDG